MDRREFNRIAIGFAANSVLGIQLVGCATLKSPPMPPSSLGESGRKGRVLLSTFKTGGSSGLRLFDWDTGHFQDYEVPLHLVHSIVQDKVDRDVLYVFEVFGSAVKVNLRTGSIRKIDHHKGQGMFNGHGALFADGEFIACTEIGANSGSTVRVRSTKDLSIVEELPKDCRSCHQIISMPGTTLLATGNAVENGTGAVTFYDYATKRVVRRVGTPDTVLHLASISSSEILGACVADKPSARTERLHLVGDGTDSLTNLMAFKKMKAHSPTPIAYASLDGRSRLLFDERMRELFAFTYSVVKTPCGRIVSTHTDAGKVLIWKDFLIERILDVEEAKNVQVSADGEELMILGNGDLHFFSMTDFRLLRRSEGWPPIVITANFT